MKTYDLIEAADFLKVNKETARQLAATGDIPGAQVGAAWVFMERDLVDYLKRVVREQTTARRDREAVESARPDSTSLGGSLLKKRGRRREPPRLEEPSLRVV